MSVNLFSKVALKVGKSACKGIQVQRIYRSTQMLYARDFLNFILLVQRKAKVCHLFCLSIFTFELAQLSVLIFLEDKRMHFA